MIIAHVLGVPVEESALTLAPAGAAIVTGAAVVARSKLARIVEWLGPHSGQRGRNVERFAPNGAVEDDRAVDDEPPPDRRRPTV